MDAIDRMLKEKMSVKEKAVVSGETWCEFEDAVKGRKLFIFGMGEGVNFYLRKYKNHSNIVGFIDNNKIMHGVGAQYFLYEDLADEGRKIKVFDKSILEKYDSNSIVVLVASLNYNDEIVKEVADYSISKVFSVLYMEINYRIMNGIVGVEDKRNEFILRLSNEPVQDNKIVLCSRCDGAGHVKQIAEQIIRCRKDVEFFWVLDDVKTDLPKYVKKIWRGNTMVLKKHMSTAKIIINEDNLSVFFDKRPGQFFIEAKHWASITLKSFGFDLAKNHKGMLEHFAGLKEMIDYVLVGSKFDELTCRSGFGFNGEAIYVGSPRSDILFRHDKEIYKKISNKYPIYGKNIILYAPTFRSKSEQFNPVATDIDLNYQLVHDTCVQTFGGEWLILLRLHPAVACYSKNIAKPSFVIDVSDYHDSEELVAIANIMITDYSSIMFEPAFVQKPVFLFATDRKEYLKKERNLLIDYDTLPFPIAESNAELANNMRSFNRDDYVRDVELFMNKYGVHEDGHASERAAKFILGLMKEA